jgi:hypothetical protein
MEGHLSKAEKIVPIEISAKPLQNEQQVCFFVPLFAL